MMPGLHVPYSGKFMVHSVGGKDVICWSTSIDSFQGEAGNMFLSDVPEEGRPPFVLETITIAAK